MIKFSKVDIRKDDTKLVSKILQSGWLTHGPYTKKFEDSLKNFTGAKYAITVSNCTAGLHLSCLALNLNKNDEVLVPAMTHTATSHAVEFTGATPVFVDVEPLTGNIDCNKIEKKITKKTKAIIIVHMAGYPCEIEKVLKICKKYNLKLIEDCAHSLGSNYKNKHLGNFGETGCFSFYPTKQITSGEGGAVITNNYETYKKIKYFKAFGIDLDINQRKIPGHYDVKYLGYNYRMTDFQSALVWRQLLRYKKNLDKRKKNAKFYIQQIKKYNLQNDISSMPFSKNCSYFIFQIFVNKNLRKKILEIFKSKKIGHSIHYAKPVPLMSFYKKKYKYKLNHFKVAKNYADESLSLPCHPDISKNEINKILRSIKKVITL